METTTLPLAKGPQRDPWRWGQGTSKNTNPQGEAHLTRQQALVSNDKVYLELKNFDDDNGD